MKLVYTHPQLIVVTQIRSLLEREGIATQLRNEYAAGAIGELPPIDSWPELWVTRDGDLAPGQELIRRHQQDSDAPDWRCSACGANCPASFDWCWQCGAAGSRG